METVMETPMAYFLWNDDGIMEFLEEYEPDFIDHFSALPRMVEKSDIFRIMVCKYIGGVVCFSRDGSSTYVLMFHSMGTSTLIRYGRRRPGLRRLTWHPGATMKPASCTTLPNQSERFSA